MTLQKWIDGRLQREKACRLDSGKICIPHRLYADCLDCFIRENRPPRIKECQEDYKTHHRREKAR